MERENLVEETVKRIIADKLGLDSQCVKTGSLLRDDLEAADIDIVELVMEFEKEFVVSIDDVEAEKFLTVGDVISCIEDKKGYHPISDKNGRVNTQQCAEELKMKCLELAVVSGAGVNARHVAQEFYNFVKGYII